MIPTLEKFSLKYRECSRIMARATAEEGSAIIFIRSQIRRMARTIFSSEAVRMVVL